MEAQALQEVAQQSLEAIQVEGTSERAYRSQLEEKVKDGSPMFTLLDKHSSVKNYHAKGLNNGVLTDKGTATCLTCSSGVGDSRTPSS